MKPQDAPSQVDRYKQEIESLQQSIAQLYALNDLAREIGVAENLEEINHKLVQHALSMIDAEQGVVTLIEQERLTMNTLIRTHHHEDNKEIFRPPPLMLGWMEKHKTPRRIHVATDAAPDLLPNWHPTVRSFLCVPLISKGHLIGLLSLFNKKSADTFSEEDEKLLNIIAMQSAQVLENQRLIEERNRVKLIFGQHVSPSIVDEILEAGTDVLSRRLPMCVMFMDIRGFSSLAEKMTPEEVMAYLNTLFDFMIECVLEHKGIIHRLLGDSFVALFGAPTSQGNDRKNAVDAGLAILERLQEECDAGRVRPTRIGIGIHAGDVVVGTVGSANRKEYQINGDVVNLAARLEQLNKEMNTQLLISETVWQALEPEQYLAEPLGKVAVKGREERATVYKLA